MQEKAPFVRVVSLPLGECGSTTVGDVCVLEGVIVGVVPSNEGDTMLRVISSPFVDIAVTLCALFYSPITAK